MTRPADATSLPRPALRSLAFGNVVIGTGALSFVGMLDTIARDLDRSPSAIGLIAGLFALGICLSGPPLSGITSRFDRRTVLTASLALFALGHVAAAAAPGYGSLLAIRVATAFAGTLFTPQAAATASLLVPAERRARSMSFVFLGWSIAIVLGMPAGALVAASFGWRNALLGVGALSAIGALLVWRRVPADLHVAVVDRAAWRAIVVHPTLLRVLSVTVLHGSAQFVLYSYIVVAYHDTLAPVPWMLTVLLALYGLSGFVGNLVAARVAERRGTPSVILVALASMTVAFGLWTVQYDAGRGTLGVLVAVTAAILWGSGNIATHSMQQVRLVDLAPALVSVSVALNTSAIYLGQFVGAAVGGLVLAHPFTVPASRALPWVALPLFALAIAATIAAQRRIERQRFVTPPSSSAAGA